VPSLFRITRDIETKLHALIAELQEVKNKARRLEKENAGLRKELAGFRAAADLDDIPLPPELREKRLNLLMLYDQGYHVCNVEFGEERSDDCLFCMAFLRRELDARQQDNS
jgi:regulator of replication initiation timing